MSNFLTKSLKKLNQMMHSGGGMFGFAVGGSGRVNYRREVGNLLDASVVMAS